MAIFLLLYQKKTFVQFTLDFYFYFVTVQKKKKAQKKKKLVITFVERFSQNLAI
jgi:hypothetical protein